MKRLRSMVAMTFIVAGLLGLAVASLGHGLRSLNAYCSDSGATDDSTVRHIAAPLYALAFAAPFAAPFAVGDDDEEWWGDFLCDIRVTDVALVILAFFLVAMGLWQGIQLRRAVSATRDAALAAKDSAAATRELVERMNRRE
jgi:hypothetical protein